MIADAWPDGLAGGWHPVAYASALRDRPLGVHLMDQAIVLFRTVNGIAALDDRCPHRNAPLSAGRVVSGEIECPYHGWRFDGAGRCTRVAGATTPATANAHPLSVCERDGLIWICCTARPAALPTLPSEITDPGFDSFWWRLPASPGAIGDAIENLLDPVHAYFLHPSLVRRAHAPHPVDIEFTADVDRCVARYTEPAAAMTWLQRLTEGERTASSGRYWPPTIVQIIFEDARGVHASITVIFSPVGRYETRPYACFSTRRGRTPAWLKRAFIIAFHRRVLDQDLRMLGLQAASHERTGGPCYQNGPLDMFGPMIWDGLNGRALTPQHRGLRLEGTG